MHKDLAKSISLKINILIKPLKTISNHLLDKKLNIYSPAKTHFPIPCLNGNMLYLHFYFYFHFEKNSVVTGIIDFFAEYQRFDDGDFKTPSSFPYYSNVNLIIIVIIGLGIKSAYEASKEGFPEISMNKIIIQTV